MNPHHETPPTPSPELDARAVVAVFLAACRSSPESAATVLWAFAGERLRRSADDPGHLARLLANDLFRPLLEHTEVTFDPLERIEQAARQVVEVEAADGQRVRYLFALSRARRGELEGCWLVSGLERA
jgi:hypothetical protein